VSNFTCPVVRIGAITKHPNADSLSTTVVEGETVVIRTGDYQEGDLAIYVPLDAVVPPTVPGTEFLENHRRIRAKRLRGVYSEGLLLPLMVGASSSSYLKVGDDLAAKLGIVKHEDKVPDAWGSNSTSNRGTSDQDTNPGCIPHYDIEPYKKYRELMVEGERVVITEKLHGCCSSYCFVVDKGFFVGSHNKFWRDPAAKLTVREKLYIFWRKLVGRPLPPRTVKPNLWWQIAKQYDLQATLSDVTNQGYAIYGEVFGQVQDIRYGAAPGQIWLRVFDIYDTVGKCWLDWDSVVWACEHLHLDTVPVLYDGPFNEEKLASLIEGKSVLADNIREGVVVKPAVTRIEPHFGRVILKCVSQAYHLRKGNTTELH